MPDIYKKPLFAAGHGAPLCQPLLRQSGCQLLHLMRLFPKGEWFLSMPERVPAILEKERSMAIEVSEIQRSYRYNGIHLPDVPGLDAREIRDLYSAQYPELVSAEIEMGEIHNGVQEITFKRAVGTKG